MDDGTVTQRRADANDSASQSILSAETGNFGQKTKISEIFSSMHGTNQAFGTQGVIRDTSIFISPRFTQDKFGEYGRSSLEQEDMRRMTESQRQL